MWLGYNENEFNTEISEHLCDDCGSLFSLCPSVPSTAPGWDNCLSEDCESYDPSRDADKMFENGEVRRDDDNRAGGS